MTGPVIHADENEHQSYETGFFPTVSGRFLELGIQAFNQNFNLDSDMPEGQSSAVSLPSTNGKSK